MNAGKLPQTDSIQELARFWDAHDVTDFEDELEVVPEPVFVGERAVTVHLSAEEASAVKRLANSKGIDGADLIREWILEKVHAG